MAQDTYEQNYSLRYAQPWLQERTEVSVVKSAQYIAIEDPSTPDHANRACWAAWTFKNSSVAVTAFMWNVALDPTVVSKGQDITDAEIDGITSAALPAVIKDFIANPPSGVTIPPQT